MRFRLPGRVAAAFSAAVLTTTVLGGCSVPDGGRGVPEAQPALFTSIAQSPDPEPAPAADTVDPPVNAGALVGNRQRSWPGGVDDSVHAKPGEYAPDVFLGRPAWTPIEHDGDLPDASALRPGSCGDFDGLKGTTQQQYVNARYMVVNDQAGPTKTVRAIPRGYAHSPAGAVLAAINTATFHPNSGDEVAAESYEQLSKTSALAATLRDEGGFNDPAGYPSHRFLTMPAPVAYRVVECDTDYVVVEVAVFFSADQLDKDEDLLVGRVPVRWSDGDWVGDFSGAANDEIYQHGRRDIEGFSDLDYV
ncbi:hypothetical protein V6D40_00970 [Corynebacterium sp. Q4381]|uniref:hypothetical protein n=1 Tax=Corynebacterium sp. Marseille-Q4381 TaxID=3121597 RepID=UPI002FE63F57